MKRKFRYAQLPTIIIFKHSSLSFRKNLRSVEFPIFLDMAPYVDFDYRGSGPVKSAESPPSVAGLISESKPLNTAVLTNQRNSDTKGQISGANKTAGKTARTLLGVLSSKVGNIFGSTVKMLSGSKRKVEVSRPYEDSLDDESELQKAIAESIKGSSQWVCPQCTLVCESLDNPCSACGNKPVESSFAPRQEGSIEEHLEFTNEEALQLPSIESLGTLYRLCAVVRHLGYDTLSGHYIADVRKTAGWQRCDDSIISDISEEKVLTEKENAYILFYERRQ